MPSDLPISILVTTGPGVDPELLGPRPSNVAAAAFVPQVCLPRGADQFANADRIRAAGAGIRLLPEEISPDRVRAAVRAVLSEQSYARAAIAAAGRDRRHADPARVLDDLTAMVGEQTRTG